MVGAKDVLPFFIKRCSANNLVGEEVENKRKSGPISVDDTYPAKFFWKENGDQQGKEKKNR